MKNNTVVFDVIYRKCMYSKSWYVCVWPKYRHKCHIQYMFMSYASERWQTTFQFSFDQSYLRFIILHITSATFWVNDWSHTVPQTPFIWISTRPSKGLLPFSSLMSLIFRYCISLCASGEIKINVRYNKIIFLIIRYFMLKFIKS
jgi:hypothetical protein